MTTAAIVACLGALGLIGLLPRIFFRRGRLNARWWLTAAPFAASALALLLALAGIVTPAFDLPALQVAAIVCALAGVALIRWTLATHSRPVSLWHQEDDRPDALITRGAYARVRHPFYASFLLVLLACALAVPHAVTIGALAAGYLLLDRTAAREERRLTREFGAAYAGYVRRTGRFVPFRAVLLVTLLLAIGSPGAAQLGDPVDTPAKRASPSVTPEQSFGADVAVGASLGLFAGLGAGAAMCMWDEFATVGLIRDEDEEDYQCDVGAPLLAVAIGTAAGALVGLVVGALGGDMPRGNFFEWSTAEPDVLTAEPKQTKIDEAES